MGFLKFFALMVLAFAVAILLTLAGVATGDGLIGTAMVLCGWGIAAVLVNYAGEQW